MITSWRNIPGNKHAFDRLRALLEDGQAISFVGAGASAGLYPLWGELIDLLVEETKRRGRGDDHERAYWLKHRDADPDQVVRGIKVALGDGIYADVLRQIFRPKGGMGGDSFTPIHAALLRLGFRGHITTNFDPGLLEARLTLRTDLRGTGYATWRDADAVLRWQTGDVFTEERCPILFAHGSWEKSDTIVLGMSEYRQAYRTGAFRRLFEHLWRTGHLVFTGFSFADDWVKFIANEVLTIDGKRTTEPRHIALIGLASDETYTSAMRDQLVDLYDAEPLFYPVSKADGGWDDHAALLEILLAVGGAAPPAPIGSTPSGSVTTPPPAAAPPAAAIGAMAEHWTHETTDDERFAGRVDALERLDRWCADPSVRAIGVTGIGGLGKTSLIGHWLKKRHGARRRTLMGLFFWSFYADRNVAAFAKAFISFMTRALGASAPPSNMAPGHAALAMLQARPVLLVLDGLEVLQERPDQAGYGTFLSYHLRDLVDGAIRHTGDSLLVLTSRFPFADLTPYLGDGFRTLDLDFLSAEEGADVLRAAGVGGAAADRKAISRRFEGHPLALRVFALTLEDRTKGDPTRLVERMFDAAHVKETGTLEGKVSRLLLFYERCLPPERVALLGLVSLFRAPVSEATILSLARGLRGVADTLAGWSDMALRQALGAMAHEDLMIRDVTVDGAIVWSCHPVLRDHFRKTLLDRGTDTATAAAGLLTGAPSDREATSVEELQPVLTAIELLLDVGDFDGAYRLYAERLSGPTFNRLLAPAEGRRCLLGFVHDARRRAASKQKLGGEFGLILNEVGLFTAMCGEFAEALQFRRDHIAFRRKRKETANFCIGLQHQSELQVILGQLAESESTARQALEVARNGRLIEEIGRSLRRLADTLAHVGRTNEALAAFDAANAVQRHEDFLGNSLRYSGRSDQWATLLVRLGDLKRARTVTIAQLRHSKRSLRPDDEALSYSVLGVLTMHSGNFRLANQHVIRAESVLQRSHFISELPRVILARAAVERAQGQYDKALATVEAALRLAAPRKMLLDQTDALVLRGRIRLDRARAEAPSTDRQQVERASDDLDDALRLSRFCGYAWAERDALTHLTEVRALLGDQAKMAALQREAEALSHRLLDTKAPDPNPFAWVLAEAVEEQA